MQAQTMKALPRKCREHSVPEYLTLMLNCSEICRACTNLQITVGAQNVSPLFGNLRGLRRQLGGGATAALSAFAAFLALKGKPFSHKKSACRLNCKRLSLITNLVCMLYC